MAASTRTVNQPHSEVEEQWKVMEQKRAVGPQRLRSCQELFSAMEQPLSNEGTKVLLSELNEAMTLKERVAELEAAVEHLKSEASEMERLQTKRIQEQDALHNQVYETFLQSHREACGKLEADRNSATKTLNDMKKDLADIKERLKRQTHLTEAAETEKRNVIQKFEVEKAKADGLSAEKKAVIEELKHKEEALGKKEAKLLEETRRANGLESSLNEMAEKKKAVDARLRTVVKDIDKMRQLYSEVHREPPELLISELKGASVALCRTVISAFEESVSDAVLSHAGPWNGFKEAVALPSTIPIYPSNSKIAKSMRAAATLALLARLLNEKIFGTTYLLENDLGLRVLLSDEATVSQEREMLCRGLLVTMQKSAQLEASEKRIDLVLRAAFNTVETLFGHNSAGDIVNKLRPIIQDITRCWWKIQRCKQRVETTVDLDLIDDWEWDIFDLEHQRPIKLGKSDASDQVKIVAIFPRVYSVMASEYDPLFPGIALVQSQTIAALKECEETKPFAGQAIRSPSTRMKLRRASQAGSSADRDAPQATNVAAFLGPKDSSMVLSNRSGSEQIKGEHDGIH